MNLQSMVVRKAAKTICRAVKTYHDRITFIKIQKSVRKIQKAYIQR